MQGFVNRAFQQYVQDMHGAAAWEEIRVIAGAPLMGSSPCCPVMRNPRGIFWML